MSKKQKNAPASAAAPAAPAAAPAVSIERLRAVFKASRLSYKEDGNGNFVGAFAANDDVPFDVFFAIGAHGDDQGILSVRLFSQKLVAPENHLKAIMAANKYNNDMRWPKTYISDDDDPRLCGEEQLDTAAGVSDEFLVEFIRGSLGHGWTMYKMLHAACF